MRPVGLIALLRGEAVRRTAISPRQAEFLRRNLRQDRVVLEDEERETLYVSQRDLPNNGEHGVWLHVVNTPCRSLSKKLEGWETAEYEIACSEPQDLVFSTKRSLLGIILEGPAEAVWSMDVWSDQDCIGRRYCPSDRTGTPRVEAWIVPSKCRVVAIVSDNPRFLEEARREGYFVIEAGKESLSRGCAPEEPLAPYEGHYVPCSLYRGEDGFLYRHRYVHGLWDKAAMYDRSWE